MLFNPVLWFLIWGNFMVSNGSAYDYNNNWFYDPKNPPVVQTYTVNQATRPNIKRQQPTFLKY